ncbi:unnamed protein product [Plutella xylostella]|uniref:(diamondback moth) hypothetical protein n=1 Tax=Plutella xylostella TaxID=51655 RepID=A0A8S4DT52_PLUXY|nr:unnamed protein product [Plutella xylostella]
MLWRWSVRFCLLVVWTNHISTLPLGNTPENASTNHNLTSRAARQADPDKECCPCPVSQRSADSEGSASMLTPSVRSAGCNCQRDAEGAASSLFDIPSQMIGAFVRPNEQKEDPKPLLHPEVGLANNFLETLREATDEEYRDAVARDAARAADTDAVSDPQQEASRNIVTIILKPPQLQPEDDEDVLASGTHIQESRCIHSPLGNERSAYESPQILMPSLLTEIMHIPGIQRMNKRRNNLLHLDNGGSASNVAENIVESPKEGKSMALAFPKGKLSSVNSGQDDPDTASSMRSNSQPIQDKVIKTDKIRKIPDFNVKSAINDINDRIKRLNAKLKKPHVPNLTIKDRNIDTTSLRSNDANIDNCPASSNVQDNELGRSTDGSSATDSQATSRSLLIPNNDVKNILTSNIFKLKDVELVSTNKNTDVKMSIPNLKLPSIDDLITQSKANTPEPFKIPTLSDLFRNSILNPEKKIDTEVIPPENTDVATTTDIDSNEKIHTVQTEILDSVPKTTDSIIAASNNNADLRSQSAPCNPVNIAETKDSVINVIPETNIIESLPIDPQPDSGTSKNNIEEKDNSDEAEENSETVSDELRNEIQVPNKPNDPINIAETKDSDVENSVENVTKKSTFKLGKLRKPTSALLEKLKKDLSPKINSLKPQPVPKNEKFNVPEDPEIFSSSSFQNNKNVGDSLIDASNQKETRNEITDMTGNPETEGRNSEVIAEDEQDLTESESQEDENNTIIPIQTVSDINGKENEVNSCPSSFVKESSGENVNEMSVGASSPITSSALPDRQTSLLGSLLKQENVIVEPTSLFDGASNTILPSLPVLNVNSVPTFENLREQLANLFGNLNENGQDDESTLRSSEDVSDEDSESEPSMASEASDPISQITGSSFQPFKEINLNLFKLSPVSLATPLTLPRLSNAGLNFDSVKARVKVPNLQWKPLKLESTFGRRDGLLGASLSLEPFNKNIQSLLPKPSIPSLDEMTSSLVARAEDLLKTQPKLTLDANSLRNTEPLIHLDTLRDSLHSNAANAMNSLQQTLESSLDEAKVRADGLLGNTRFAQPENLLDIARFDVDDKLKELHSNLADHLSSVHEKLMDPSTFSTLASPLLGSPLEFPPLTPPNLLQSASSNVNKKKPRNKLSRPVAKSRTALKSSEPAFKPKLREQHKKTTSPVERRILKSNLAKQPSWLSNNKVNTPKVSKPKPKQSLFTKTSTPRFPNTKELSSTKAATKPPFKLPRPTPRPLAIEKPKISPVRPIPPIERRPLLRKRVQQTPDTQRFKAALISTTTPRALFPASFRDTHQRLFAPKTATTATTPNPQRAPSFPARNLGSSRLSQATPKAFEHLKFPKDVYGSPSEQVLSKAEPTSDIFKLGSFTPNNERSDLLTRAREQLKPKFKVNIGKMELPERTGAFKTISPQIPLERSNEIEDDVTTNTDIIKPKALLDENDMLAKLKDTIKNKLGIDLKSPLDKKALSLQTSPDMDEGASESKGMNAVLDDAMVENVAYKCNMVCTKEQS